MNYRNSLTYAKRCFKVIAGRDLFFRRDVDIESIRLGSDYGGWDFAPEFLDANSVVYSFGVGRDASFDIALIERFGLVVNAFDPTPKSKDWVETQDFPSQFQFHSFGLADLDGELSFFPPKQDDWVSYSVTSGAEAAEKVTLPVKRFGSILTSLGHRTVDLLKADIEGSEYGFIEDLTQSDVLPGQLLIEFHHRFPEFGPGATKLAVQRLRKIGYRLFYISNSGEELSFIHKSLLAKTS